jgi:hypothetical protein
MRNAASIVARMWLIAASPLASCNLMAATLAAIRIYDFDSISDIIDLINRET